MGDQTTAAGIEKQMLSAKSVAELFDTSERTIWRWVSAGKIIVPLRIGEGTTRWRAADLYEWIGAGCPDPKRFRK